MPLSRLLICRFVPAVKPRVAYRVSRRRPNPYGEDRARYRLAAIREIRCEYGHVQTGEHAGCALSVYRAESDHAPAAAKQDCSVGGTSEPHCNCLVGTEGGRGPGDVLADGAVAAARLAACPERRVMRGRVGEIAVL